MSDVRIILPLSRFKTDLRGAYRVLEKKKTGSLGNSRVQINNNCCPAVLKRSDCTNAAHRNRAEKVRSHAIERHRKHWSHEIRPRENSSNGLNATAADSNAMDMPLP